MAVTKKANVKRKNVATTPAPAVTSNTQALLRIVSNNLQKLIKEQGLTQRKLAEKLGIAAASMSDYCKGKRLPTVEHLAILKKLYGISIDDFLTAEISPAAITPPPEVPVFDQQTLEAYKKFCSSYFLYYFDTSKMKGRDTQPPRDSLLYGILYVYELHDKEVPAFECMSILGFEDRDEVARAKKELDEMEDPQKKREYLISKYESSIYLGRFTLSKDNAFVSMTHGTTDKALLILPWIDSSSKPYIGGIGTINSVSKGRERMPVIQLIGVSRYTLGLSVEEIHHSLLLDQPTFEVDGKTVDEMIMNFKALYVDPNSAMVNFSEYQKTIFVRSMIEQIVRRSLERNVFRYGKVSGADDDLFYHKLKDASIIIPDKASAKVSQ